MDVSQPEKPNLAGRVDTPGAAKGLWICEDLALVADDAAGLLVMDVRSPASPLVTGFHSTPGFASGVSSDGRMAFVADGWAGLRVIDIRPPASPLEVAAYNSPTRSVPSRHCSGYGSVEETPFGIEIFRDCDHDSRQ